MPPVISRMTPLSRNNEKFCQLLNSCQNPEAICAALLALSKAGLLGKLREEARREDSHSDN